METKAMKRMRRIDLMALIVKQQERIEQLESENRQLRGQLESRILVCENTGNLAEAALKINGIFEDAQRAAEQYLESVRAAETVNPGREEEDVHQKTGAV